MKVNTNTTYGGSAKAAKDGFNLAMVVDVPWIDGLPEKSQKQATQYVAICFASLAYRGGAGTLNGKLGVEKNSDVEYSDASAKVVGDTLEEWFADACPNKKGTDTTLSEGVTVDITVTRYTPGESASPMVRATTFVETNMDGKVKESSMRMLFGAMGMDGAEKADKEKLVEFANKNGIGVQPARKK